MNIIETSEFEVSDIKNSYHVLTFAEIGFAMLSIYGNQFDLEQDTIEAFSEKVNERDESGSLHPEAPISAVPRHFIRDDENADTLEKQIKDFLRANHKIIKAKKLLFDFRAGVASFVITACRNALNNSPNTDDLEEVIIINEN